MVNDLPEIIVESATQSPEEVDACLQKMGFDGIQTTGQSDQPEPKPPVEKTPAAKPAAELTEQTSETSDAGSDAGEQEPPAAGDDTPAAPQHKKPGSARYREQARIARENEERAKQENEVLKRKLAELEAAGSPKPATPPTESVPAKPVAETAPPIPELRAKPRYEDFENSEDPQADFIEAMAEYKAEEREHKKLVAEAERKQQEEQQKQTQEVEQSRTRAAKDLEETQNRWKSSVETAKLRFDDFDTVMSAPRQQPVPPVLVATVVERDDVEPAELAYWLTKHPEKEKALTEIVKGMNLPDNPTSLQIAQAKRKLNAALDAIAEKLIAADEAEPEPEETDAVPSQAATPGTAAAREGRAATAPVSTPAAKRPPQNPPPRASAPPPSAAPKKKPAVPEPVGSRGASNPRSAMERAQKGEPVDHDAFRAEWERKHNRSLPL